MIDVSRSAPLLLGSCLAAALVASTWAGEARPQETPRVGYDDGPFLPDSPYRVHDGSRPQPQVVASAGAVVVPPPADATVLFDGSGLGAWQAGGGGDAKWELDDGAMVVNGTGSIQTREHFGDCQIHLEWATPAEVKGNSQGRGNSGVFLMGRYEIQVLDSFQNPTYPDGQAAAMYGQFPPIVNVSVGPGEWQSYDIYFRAPRFDGETLREPARITVIHNGVCVHHARAFLGATTHRALAKYSPHADAGPVQLQDHGNPVRFRNIWVRPLGSPTED